MDGHVELHFAVKDSGIAADANEALRLLDESTRAGDPYRVAILDYHMPEKDGLMLAQQIKSDPALAGIRLMMLTSVCQRFEPAKLKAAGIEACLIKPVKVAQLQQSLLKLIAAAPPLVSSPTDQPASGKIDLLASSTPPKRSPVKILLAEDNAVNQKVALRQLQKLGFSADAVANGLEVLSALKRIPYEIILMDCVMPEMDGYEAARQIRLGKAGRAPVRIIAMTANAMQDDRDKCLAAGMDDYVSKPVRFEDLKTTLERQIAMLRPTGT